eukprot:942144-Pleurochrysis_carterae.AAC.1
MVASMEASGRRKYEKEDQRAYVAWKVSIDDVLQLIRVWLYMLAFPMNGDRCRATGRSLLAATVWATR